MRTSTVEPEPYTLPEGSEDGIGMGADDFNHQPSNTTPTEPPPEQEA